jgi:Integrase zinc binding domain
VHLSNELQEKLWNGYMTDNAFAWILRQLHWPQASKKGDTLAQNTIPQMDNPTYDEDDAPAIEETLEQFAENRQKERATITDGTFTVIDKALYFLSQGKLRLCIPRDMIEEILRQNYDLIRHPGIRRTYVTIHLRYYILCMSLHVKRYVNNYSFRRVCPTESPRRIHQKTVQLRCSLSGTSLQNRLAQPVAPVPDPSTKQKGLMHGTLIEELN